MRMCIWDTLSYKNCIRKWRSWSVRWSCYCGFSSSKILKVNDYFAIGMFACGCGSWASSRCHSSGRVTWSHEIRFGTTILRLMFVRNKVVTCLIWDYVGNNWVYNFVINSVNYKNIFFMDVYEIHEHGFQGL